MQRLEVSGAVRPIYGSLGVKRLTSAGVKDSLSPRQQSVHHSDVAENCVAYCSLHFCASPIRYVITIGGLTCYTGYSFYRATHYGGFIAKEACIRWDIL